MAAISDDSIPGWPAQGGSFQSRVTGIILRRPAGRCRRASSKQRKIFEMAIAELVVSSRSNARVKQLRAAFQGHARLSGGLVAIEGGHLLEEVLRSGMVLETVFVS